MKIQVSKKLTTSIKKEQQLGSSSFIYLILHSDVEKWNKNHQSN